MPGHVFDALEEAAQYLRMQHLSDAITVVQWPRLVDASHDDAHSGQMDAAKAVWSVQEEMKRVFSGKTEEELNWESWEQMKRMPGVRVNPKRGVGNG